MDLLVRYCTEIESDLSRFHHRDIGDWYLGEMSSRELLVVVRHFPEESATKAAMRDDPWTTMHHLLANVQDLFTYYRGDFANANGQTANPESLRRPGADKRETTRLEAQRSKHQSLMASIGGTTPQ